jgi:hypothetical protein
VAVKAAEVQNMARHVLRNALVLWLSGQGNRHSVLRSCTGTPSRIFIESRNKKNVRFPRTEDAMNRIMAGFEERFCLPRRIGAIDGTVIPMKKPSRAATGGDSDAYWYYKGFPAMLGLFVFDVEGMLLLR